jgi:hypothetical protein
VPVVTPEQSTVAQDAPFENDLGMSGIVPMPDTAQLMPDVAERADGFESTEFLAPESPILPTAGLQSAFEEETGIYGAAVQPLDGLDTPDSVHAAQHGGDAGALPELEGDHGFVVPPHGDPIAPTAAAPASPAADFPMLDGAFEMPGEPVPAAPAVAPVSSEATEASEAAESMELMDFELPETEAVPDASPAGSALPVELPPEVIAAEAELVDAGMSLESPNGALESELDFASDESEPASADLPFIDTAEESPEPVQAAAHATSGETEDVIEHDAAAARTPFVTETMAELYVSQGLHDRALAVYEQLSAAKPDDARLADRVAALRASTTAPTAVSSGPTVREFLSRLASRRPGAAAANAAPPEDDDFATTQSSVGSDDASSFERVPPSAHEPTTQPADEVSAPAPADSPARPSGSIDALFGNQASGQAEDSAAAALAQAFGSAPSAPPISGKPARPAAGELSLDSVFRDGPARAARTSQGFSFDQFFSQNPEGETTGGSARTSQELPAEGEPAEKGSDDIEQFNSWLQGLKNR